MESKTNLSWLLVSTSLPYGGNTQGHLVLEGTGLDANYLESHRTQLTWGFKEGELEAAKVNINSTNMVTRKIKMLNDSGKVAFLLPAGEGASVVVAYVRRPLDNLEPVGWAVEELTKLPEGLLVTCEPKVIQSFNSVNHEVPVGVPIPWVTDTVPTGFLPYTGIQFNTKTFPELASLYPDGFLIDLSGDFLRAAEVGRAIWSKQGQSVQPLGFAGNALPPHAHNYARVHSTGGLYGVSRANYFGEGASSAVSAGTPSGSITGTGPETRPRNMGVRYITRAA